LAARGLEHRSSIGWCWWSDWMAAEQTMTGIGRVA